MKLAVAFIVAVAIASGFAVSANADDPIARTTYFTQCSFGHATGADPGTTECSQTIVIVSSACWEGVSGMRLWEEDHFAYVRSYRGNAVLPGLDGVTVNADYGSVLRPHVRLIDVSGPHAFGFTFPVADASCP